MTASQPRTAQTGPASTRLGLIRPARQDQRGVAEVDEGDVATGGDAPPMAELGGQAGLASVRDFRMDHWSGHQCIVTGALQGAARLSPSASVARPIGRTSSTTTAYGPLANVLRYVIHCSHGSCSFGSSGR